VGRGRDLGGEDLGDGGRVALGLGEGLADGLPALGEERVRRIAAAAPGQLAGGGDPPGALGQQWEDPVPLTPRKLGASLRTGPTGVRVARGDGVLFQAACWPVASGFAASAARADSTSEVNVAGSLTASSARTLRSSSMPASLRPCMNRL
jgi:hypothetical protein